MAETKRYVLHRKRDGIVVLTYAAPTPLPEDDEYASAEPTDIDPALGSTIDDVELSNRDVQWNGSRLVRASRAVQDARDGHSRDIARARLKAQYRNTWEANGPFKALATLLIRAGTITVQDLRAELNRIVDSDIADEDLDIGDL